MAAQAIGSSPLGAQGLVGIAANDIASALPQGIWSGNPIRNILGIPVTNAAAGNATQPTQSVQGISSTNYNVPGPNGNMGNIGVSTNNPSQSSSNSNPSNYKGNVGDIINGMRWTGVGWENAGGSGSGPQGISQQQLDDAYAPVFGDIQNLYNTANSNKQNYLNAATQPFDALQPGIDQALTVGQNLNQQQTAQNNAQTQNALAAARQLYNELQQGVQQRFGGVSSAGDFAKAFYGRQLQQNEGQAYGTQGQNQQSLATQMQNIQSQHDAATQQLQAQKASALSQAQMQFQQMLQQIDSLKTQTDQQKAASKLDALNQLNQTANGIQQQFAQFQQNLQLQNQSALDQLRNGVATAQAYSGQPVNLSSIAPILYSQMGGGQAQSMNPYFQVTGNLGQKTDQFGNPIR